MNEEELKALIKDAVKENTNVEDVAKEVMKLLPGDTPVTKGEQKDAKTHLVQYLNYLKLQFKAAQGDNKAITALREKADGISGGGYSVPPTLSSMIIEHDLQQSDILNRVQSVPMTSRSVEVPVSGIIDTDDIKVVERAGLKPVLTHDFSTVKLEAKKRAPIVAVPDELFDEFVGNAATYVADKLLEAVTVKKEINVVAEILSTQDAQNVVFDAATDQLADKLLALQDALTKSARAKGVYLMNNTVISQIRKLKDNDGRYIYQSPGEGRPGTLWDRPILEVDALPDYSSSNKVIAVFVNLDKVLVGNYGDVQLSVSTEATLTVNNNTKINLWQQNMTGFRVEHEYDVKVGLPSENVALLKKQ